MADSTELQRIEIECGTLFTKTKGGPFYLEYLDAEGETQVKYLRFHGVEDATDKALEWYTENVGDLLVQEDVTTDADSATTEPEEASPAEAAISAETETAGATPEEAESETISDASDDDTEGEIEEISAETVADESAPIEELGIGNAPLTATVRAPKETPSASKTKADIAKSKVQLQMGTFLANIQTATGKRRNRAISVAFIQLVEYALQANTESGFNELLAFMDENRAFMTPPLTMTGLRGSANSSRMELVITTLMAMINPRRRVRLTMSVIPRLRAALNTKKFTSVFPNVVAGMIERLS